MPRRSLTLLTVWGIAKIGQLFTLFCAQPFKALFSRREFGFGAAVLFLGLGILPAAAGAEQQCGRHDAMVRALSQKHQESQIATAVTASGHRLEVFASPGGATYSILVSTPGSEFACLKGWGENWRPVEILPGEPS